MTIIDCSCGHRHEYGDACQGETLGRPPMSELELTAKITGGIATGGEPKSIVEITYKQRSSFLLVVAASDAPAIVARIEGKPPLTPTWATILLETVKKTFGGKCVDPSSTVEWAGREIAKLQAENERLKQELLIERGVANVACHFLATPHGEPGQDEECKCASCVSLAPTEEKEDASDL